MPQISWLMSKRIFTEGVSLSSWTLFSSLSSYPHPHPASPSDVGCSWTPRRPSSCWSTSTAWCPCPPPSLRSMSRRETRTASSTWSTPRRRPSAAREGEGRESGTHSIQVLGGRGEVRKRCVVWERPDTSKLHHPLHFVALQAHVAAPCQSVYMWQTLVVPLSLS